MASDSLAPVIVEALLFLRVILVGIGCRFHGFFHTLYHWVYGSLRFVEAQVQWIPEDHEIILECWRSDFVSSICFLRVCLVFWSVWLFRGKIYIS